MSLIKADHREVEKLFAMLEKTTERAVQKRKTLFEELLTELELHTEGEEKALYPRLKEHVATEDIAFESVEEHAVAKFLIGKLSHTACDSKEWTAQITALKEAIEHHVEEEEEEMFAQMRKVFDKADLQEMGMRFDEVKARKLGLARKAA
jgi:hemerythrin superfamily protein